MMCPPGTNCQMDHSMALAGQDLAGVSMAAIKALEQRTAELQHSSARK